MSTSTSSKPIFRGDNGEECEEFIRAIREYTFDKRKDEDPKWIASFTATCLSGSALRWHSQLAPEIKKNWDRLEEAILNRYPPISSSTMPTPAAAPAMPRLSFTARHSLRKLKEAPPMGLVQRRGRVRFIDSANPGQYRYVREGDDGVLLFTSDRSLAGIVCLEPAGNLFRLGLPRPAGPRGAGSPAWVGVQWNEPLGSKLGTSTTSLGSLIWTIVDHVGDLLPLKADGGPGRTSIWSLDRGDTLKAVWVEGDGQKYDLDLALLFPSEALYLAFSIAGARVPSGGSCKGRIVFEALDE